MLIIKGLKIKAACEKWFPLGPGDSIPDPIVLNISLSQKGSDAESRTVKRLVRFFSSYTIFFGGHSDPSLGHLFYRRKVIGVHGF